MKPKLGRPPKSESFCAAIDKALSYFGGSKELGDVLGISDSQVRKLRYGKYVFKYEYAFKIEELTKGIIKATDFSPIQARRDFTR